MRFTNLFKYLFRFLLLQTLLTAITIWYFDNFLIGDYFDGYIFIRDNLLEDRLRFYPFLPYNFVKIDIYLAFFVFSFLVILYLSKFYSYVNELTFSANKSLFDEFFSIYLIWTASFLSFLQLFRFETVSRGYTLIFTILIPLFLVAFRNSEFISTILGRNPTKENFITFNLESDSIFSELRILSFRNRIQELKTDSVDDFKFYKDSIEKYNKSNKLNLIVFDFSELKTVPLEFEKFLINLNKKILVISNPDFYFNSNLIVRNEMISGKAVFYLNNDIQYGSKYIIKRLLDISLVVILSIFLLPIIFSTLLYLIVIDGLPVIIKQTRVGLHGNNFKMYKFRTMYNDSHKKRADLEDLNQHNGPLFKIDNDPRILKGAKFLRALSIDEIPQIFNVIKGEMSLVGPRPLFPEDNSYFNENYMRRLNVLPGITGLLQINERNTDDFNVWYKYDLEYIENWSIFLDLKIILKTPFAILNSKIKGK